MVNKGRKRRSKVNEEIGMDKWREYFMRLLGGVEWSQDNDGRGKREESREGVELKVEEVERVMKGMKR